MEIYSSLWDISSAVCIFFIGAVIFLSISKNVYLKQSEALFIYCWHSLFSIVYLAYTLKNPADSFRYYNSNAFEEQRFSLGTRAVEYFTGLLKYVDLSYLSCFLVYNIIGAVGLLIFAGALKKTVKNSGRNLKFISLIIVLLPSISFWSSAIGKDAISFLAINMALWAALALNKNKGLMVSAIILMLIVRPHIAGMIVLALSFSIVFDKNINSKLKAGFLLFSIASSVVMIPFALNYAGVGNEGSVDTDALQSYIEKRQGYNMEGGAGVDIASMSLPMQMFTYMFRPLPYEASGISSLLASLDNVFLLFIFILGLKSVLIKKLKQEKSNRKFMWLYASGTLVILSLTTANLGIALRQKWMFVPMFLYLFVSAMAYSRKSLSKRTRFK